jgi:CBS domain-containing protein
VKVSEAMTPSVVTVSRDTPLADAARLMRDSDVGPLPVADEGRLVGVLTDRDITIRAVADGRDPFSTRVDEVMTPKVVCCLDTDEVEHAAEMMQSAQLRRLLVVSEDGRLAGIVSLGDIAVRIGNDSLSGETLQHVSEPPPGR